MTPYKHQEELSDIAADILVNKKLVYLAMEERTGKSLTALLAIEKCETPRNVLVITKKGLPVKGWQDTIENFKSLITRKIIITTYHQAHKVTESYGLVILDECHNYICGVPKRSAMLMKLRLLCVDKPMIYISATPHPQGRHMLYHQFYLSSYGPWDDYRDYYAWYKEYAARDATGKPETVWVRGNEINTWKGVQEDRIVNEVAPYMVTKTRRAIGFEQEPEDKLHYIELSDTIRTAYNMLSKDKILSFENGGKNYTLVADTVAKLRSSLHMLEGGGFKVDDEYIILNSKEKIQHIKDTWGDTSDIVIMYQYIVEGLKLKQNFKNATILQGDTNSEGIDLSHKKHLIIYSQSWSTGKHTQRRARQANKNRQEPIIVHFLLVKNAVSDTVYKTVSVNQKNYVSSVYTPQFI